MATKTVFIIAGEASGDLLGAALMRDLKQISQNDLVFIGVGGPQMAEQGLASLFPMNELSVMGFFEVAKHLPRILHRMKQTVEAILSRNPDVIITVDAPDFGLRVAKKIKKLRPDIRLVHYVAPTVWAWRPGRAKKIAAFLDGLMCLFPFEPPYFEVHGLKARFVGHPLSRDIPTFTDVEIRDFCVRHALNPEKPILCVLPGSRLRELDSLGPSLKATLQQLKKSLPDLQVILPTMPHLKERLASFMDQAYVFVPESNHEKYLAFAASRAALHASGTVALELALCRTPMVTIYKLNAVSAWIGKRIIKTPYANLVNILLRHPVVPELLQEKAEPQHMVPMVQALLTNETLRQLQREQLDKIRQALTESEPQAAAGFIESFLSERPVS